MIKIIIIVIYYVNDKNNTVRDNNERNIAENIGDINQNNKKL